MKIQKENTSAAARYLFLHTAHTHCAHAHDMASMDVLEVDGAVGSASSAQAEPPQASLVIPGHSGLLLPAASRLVSRPISRLCSLPFSRLCSRPISRPVPDQFHDPVPPRNRGLPSRPVNQMAFHLPVLFPSRGKQTGTFSRTVAREDPKTNPPAAC